MMSRRLPDLILRTQSDERLLALSRTGHESAFAVLVDRYRRPLLAHARPIVGDARAEDAVQDGLARTWQSVQDGAEIQNVRAWLYRVVHNAALDARRARGFRDGELADTLPSQADTAATVIEQAETREMLGALAALPAAQREAMLMTAVEGRSGEETARMLGVSEGAVHQLVHRARTGLRSGLSAITPWPLVVWAASGGGAGAIEAGGAGLFGMTAVKLSVVLAAGGAAAGGATVAANRSAEPVASGRTASEAQVRRSALPGAPVGTVSRVSNTERPGTGTTAGERDGHGKSEDDGPDDKQSGTDRSGGESDHGTSDDAATDRPEPEQPRSGSGDDTRGRSGSGRSDKPGEHRESTRAGRTDDSESSGSGSSGSGSSGSGSSGSESSRSGSSEDSGPSGGGGTSGDGGSSLSESGSRTSGDDTGSGSSGSGKAITTITSSDDE